MKSPTRSHFAASLVGGAVVAGTLLVLGVTGHGNTETIIEGIAVRRTACRYRRRRG